jgi:PAS domain S-box-containing protein
MTATTPTTLPAHKHRADKASASMLALGLAHAENALRALTSDKVDAIVDPDGHAYLLRSAQEQLRRSERRLQAVIESVADVITVVNRGGVILSQSDAVRRVLGYQPEDLVGRRLFDLVHNDDLPAIYSSFFNVIEGFRTTATVQFRHQAFDGSYRPIEATLDKLRDASSPSVVLSMRPRASLLPSHTELAPREAALAEALLGKDHFLAILSHELRTPLTPILLGVQELEDEERFAAARSTLTMIRRNIELQSRLLEELCEFTSVGFHKVRLHLEPIDAHEVVRLALEICESELTSAQIVVLLDLRATERQVLADSARLQQVLWNLIKNAIKFSAPGTSICISTVNHPPDRLTIELVDHGIGIEPALLPLIFDSFQQGDLAMQQRFGGLGLGLFIARGLTEAQGGSLTALSEGRGKGATFRLTLNTAATSNTLSNARINL